MLNEVSRMFYDDIRSKKITGYGVKGRASRKKGFKGNIKLPSDNYKGRAFDKYCKENSGEVEVYSMYDKIASKEEFLNMDALERRKALKVWLKKYSIEEVGEQWGDNIQNVRNHVYRLALNQFGEDYVGTQVTKAVRESLGLTSKELNNDDTRKKLNQSKSITKQPTPEAKSKFGSNNEDQLLKLIKELKETNKELADNNKELADMLKDSKKEKGQVLILNDSYTGKETKNRILGFMESVSDSYMYKVEVMIREEEYVLEEFRTNNKVNMYDEETKNAN